MPGVYMNIGKKSTSFSVGPRGAKLLESSVIVLCDKFGLIVYERKKAFDRSRYTKYYWEKMDNPDIYKELKNKLTNKNIQL